MNTKLLPILLFTMALFVGAPSVRADLLIYQTRTTVTGTGGEFEIKFGARSFMVWNLDTDEFGILTYYTSASGIRRYGVSTGTQTIAVVTGLRGRSFTVFSRLSTGENSRSMGTERGQNAVLKHRTGEVVLRPRTFKGTSYLLTTDIPARTTDTSFTRVYSQARTIAANDAGQTLDDVMTSLRAEVEGLGYVEN